MPIVLVLSQRRTPSEPPRPSSGVEGASMFQGQPLVLRYLSNAGVLQRWRMMWQIMVILDAAKYTSDERGRIRRVSLYKKCRPCRRNAAGRQTERNFKTKRTIKQEN